LTAFQALFDGKRYLHRNSTHGDKLALEFYEDIYSMGLSLKFIQHVDSIRRGISTKNTRAGVPARRGDGTFGEFIPGQSLITVPGYSIKRGPVATLDIGVEVKIINKAMGKQVDERISSLQKQSDYFVSGRDRQARDNPIRIAIIGLNHAEYTIGYEGTREYRTDGKAFLHPSQEVESATKRIKEELAPHFDETIILRYKTTNEDPYPFQWVNRKATELDYGASLVRIAKEYEQRF